MIPFINFILEATASITPDMIPVLEKEIAKLHNELKGETSGKLFDKYQRYLKLLKSVAPKSSILQDIQPAASTAKKKSPPKESSDLTEEEKTFIKNSKKLSIHELHKLIVKLSSQSDNLQAKITEDPEVSQDVKNLLTKTAKLKTIAERVIESKTKAEEGKPAKEEAVKPAGPRTAEVIQQDVEQHKAAAHKVVSEIEDIKLSKDLVTSNIKTLKASPNKDNPKVIAKIAELEADLNSFDTQLLKKESSLKKHRDAITEFEEEKKTAPKVLSKDQADAEKAKDLEVAKKHKEVADAAAAKKKAETDKQAADSRKRLLEKLPQDISEKDKIIKHIQDRIKEAKTADSLEHIPGDAATASKKDSRRRLEFINNLSERLTQETKERDTAKETLEQLKHPQPIKTPSKEDLEPTPEQTQTPVAKPPVQKATQSWQPITFDAAKAFKPDAPKATPKTADDVLKSVLPQEPNKLERTMDDVKKLITKYAAEHKQELEDPDYAILKDPKSKVNVEFINIAKDLLKDLPDAAREAIHPIINAQIKKAFDLSDRTMQNRISNAISGYTPLPTIHPPK